MEQLLDDVGFIPNPYFHTISSLTWYIFKTYRNPTRKIQDSLENSNKKGFFHKTPSSQFYLIGTFFGPNLFSLTLLIAYLMTCDRFDRGEQ